MQIEDRQFDRVEMEGAYELRSVQIVQSAPPLAIGKRRASTVRKGQAK